MVGFNHALLPDVLDAVDASNEYVHFSDCLVDAVLRQHGGALAQFGNSVFRVAVHGLNEDVQETWHERECQLRELATSMPTLSASSVNCPAGQVETLSRASLGIRSLRWCRVWHKTVLAVRDAVRFPAPALLEHNRKDVVDPLRHAAYRTLNSNSRATENML